MAFSPKYFAHLVYYIVSWPMVAAVTVVWALGENESPNSPNPISPQEWN